MHQLYNIDGCGRTRRTRSNCGPDISTTKEQKSSRKMVRQKLAPNLQISLWKSILQQDHLMMMVPSSFVVVMMAPTDLNATHL